MDLIINSVLRTTSGSYGASGCYPDGPLCIGFYMPTFSFYVLTIKSPMHRRARLVLPYQARFKICLISNSSKNREFIQTTSKFQARSENLKSQNLNFKQDPRI